MRKLLCDSCGRTVADDERVSQLVFYSASGDSLFPSKDICTKCEQSTTTAIADLLNQRMNYLMADCDD